MHIALGYRWFPTAAGYHIERALRALGHTVTYVGLPCGQRPGYDTTVPLDEIIAALPEKRGAISPPGSNACRFPLPAT
ncbi:MAG: hypothetical protein NZ572_08085 [Thermoflexus sp.]|nr:hypothetical protein [Thermoflexus sp.]